MAASPKVAPPAVPGFDLRTIKVYEPKPKPPGLRERVRILLIQIFEGHQEFLGFTPD
jgi:hypothetical protein